MKRIETDERYHYTKLFDVNIDSNKLCYETVGKDDSGNLILHQSQTINNSSGYGDENTYYILNDKEYSDYLHEARKNGYVNFLGYNKLLKETGNKKTTKAKTFTVITLSLSGMRFSCEYELEMKDDYVNVSEYQTNYRKDMPPRTLIKSISRPVETILKLLNDCKVLSWDGFNGPHPKGVLDGIMFTLKGNINGYDIYACGSQNFPKHFHDFRDGLYKILSE